MSISVVVPTHNEGAMLGRTVTALLASLPADAEVVVVDDQSSDDSTKGMDAIPRLRMIRPPERIGVAAARNLGANVAVGSLLVFSDAHVEPDAVWARHFERALADPGVGAVGPAILAMGSPSDAGYGRRWKDAALNAQWMPRQAAHPYPVPMLGGGFLAMRREVFEETGGFDTGLLLWGGEDLELCARLWMLDYSCLVLPAVRVAHLFRARSPYPVPWELVLHNLLRIACVHFSDPALTRVVTSLRGHPAFPVALVRLLASDVWTRRESVRACRAHDDDWYLRRFSMDLPIVPGPALAHRPVSPFAASGGSDPWSQRS
jgi:GT2 family glycosyltransferase